MNWEAYSDQLATLPQQLDRQAAQDRSSLTGLNAATLRERLVAERQLREASQAYAGEVKAALLHALKYLAPEILDELSRQSPTALDQASPAQLVNRLLAAVLPQITAASMGSGIETEEVVALQERIRELEAEIAALTAGVQAAAFQESLPDSGEESDQPQPVFNAAEPNSKAKPMSSLTLDFEPAVAPDLWPAWLRDYYQRHPQTFEVHALLVRVQGETGAPLRRELTDHVAEHLDQTRTSGTISRALKALLEAGLLAARQARFQRYRPHLVWLSEQGIDLYRLLCGAEPSPQLAPQLLARHKSATHTWLIYRTAQLLREAGYEVDLFPDRVTTDLGTYEADLAADLGGRRIFIEVERNTTKDDVAGRTAKWLRYGRVSPGEFYLVVEDEAAKTKLLSDLRAWRVFEQQTSVYILNLDCVHGPKGRATGWEIWGEPVLEAQLR